MADTEGLPGTSRENARARWIHGASLEVVPACSPSHSPAANLLSWMLPAARPHHEGALADFMVRMARRYEGPFVFFDFARIEDVLRWLGAVERRQRCRFLVPVKSFPHPRFLELSCGHVAGFDVSNLSEYRSLPFDLSGKTVALTSPVLRTEHLPQFLERGNDLLVFIDSHYQHTQLESLALPLRYGIRLDSSGIVKDLPAGGASRLAHSRFGVSTFDPSAVRPLLTSATHRFAGFHVHHGSERNDTETYMAMVEGIEALRTALGIEIDCVDLGGGQHRLDLTAFESTVAGIRQRLGDRTELYLEPGRLITQGAGYAVGRVENWKRRDDTVEYTLDLSMDCHLRWSTPSLIVPRPVEPERPLLARFHGPTCHEDDRMGNFGLWTTSGNRPPFEPGDLVLFGNISGYSASARMSFNGIDPVPVRFLSPGTQEEMQR